MIGIGDFAYHLQTCSLHHEDHGTVVNQKLSVDFLVVLTLLTFSSCFSSGKIKA